MPYDRPIFLAYSASPEIRRTSLNRMPHQIKIVVNPMPMKTSISVPNDGSIA